LTAWVHEAFAGKVTLAFIAYMTAGLVQHAIGGRVDATAQKERDEIARPVARLRERLGHSRAHPRAFITERGVEHPPFAFPGS
jgi:hypothetical protein